MLPPSGRFAPCEENLQGRAFPWADHGNLVRRAAAVGRMLVPHGVYTCGRGTVLCAPCSIRVSAHPCSHSLISLCLRPLSHANSPRAAKKENSRTGVGSCQVDHKRAPCHGSLFSVSRGPFILLFLFFSLCLFLFFSSFFFFLVFLFFFYLSSSSSTCNLNSLHRSTLRQHLVPAPLRDAHSSHAHCLAGVAQLSSVLSKQGNGSLPENRAGYCTPNIHARMCN